MQHDRLDDEEQGVQLKVAESSSRTRSVTSTRTVAGAWSRLTARDPLASQGVVPALVWAITSALALGAERLAPGAEVGVAIAGAVVAVALLRGPALPLTLIGLVPAAIGESAPTLAWIGGGAFAAAAVARGTAVVSVQMNDMQRHLAWCRRRDEPAAAFVMRFPTSKIPKPVELVSSFRVTDTIDLRRNGSGYELEGLLDQQGLDRAALERRVAAL